MDNWCCNSLFKYWDHDAWFRRGTAESVQCLFYHSPFAIQKMWSAFLRSLEIIQIIDTSRFKSMRIRSLCVYGGCVLQFLLLVRFTDSTSMRRRSVKQRVSIWHKCRAVENLQTRCVIEKQIYEHRVSLRIIDTFLILPCSRSRISCAISSRWINRYNIYIFMNIVSTLLCKSRTAVRCSIFSHRDLVRSCKMEDALR